jgi:hypothetical protein
VSSRSTSTSRRTASRPAPRSARPWSPAPTAGSRGTDRGDLVRFRLRDGSTGEVYFESRFDHPDRGETIEVYRSGDGWGSPQERSTYGLAGGIGALALSGLLALGWFRVRRRGSLSPASR